MNRRHIATGTTAAGLEPSQPASRSAARQSHADYDVAVRRAKGEKIRRLLSGRVALDGARVLEIGTGSGVISAMLADDVGDRGEVWSVDVVDQRHDREAVNFVRVSDTSLPFDDASFDLVLSNHVIEHVGDLAAQRHHLAEIARVLRPGAWCYLAMPNRWTPMEPHFKLPLLAWLPERRRTMYVRLAHRGDRYDCRPLSRRQLLRLFDAHGFQYQELTSEAARMVSEFESVRLPVRLLLSWLPVLVRAARPIVPSVIFLARPRPEA